MILLPLDGSPSARAALPHAIAMARRCQSELVLLGVAEDWYTGDVEPAPPESVQLLSQHLEECCQEARAADVPAGILERSGVPAEQIVKVARRDRAGMIVMSAHGRRGFGRWLLGGVTARVVREADCPVMVVRGDSTPDYHRILLPLDGSGYSALALPHAVRLARADRAQICLLRVIDRPDWLGAPGTDLGELLAAAQDDLGQLAAELSARGCRALVEAAAGEPAERILQIAEGGFDLIVMATHGWRWGKRQGLGSTAERVAWCARCPILLIRGQLMSVPGPEASSPLREAIR